MKDFSTLNLIVGIVTVVVAAFAAYIGAYVGARVARKTRREERQEEALGQLRFHVADMAYYAHGLAHKQFEYERLPDRWELAGKEMEVVDRFWRRNWLATIIDLDVQRAVVALREAWDATKAIPNHLPTTDPERSEFNSLSEALHVLEGVIEERLVDPVPWKDSVDRLRRDPAYLDRRRTYEDVLNREASQARHD